MKDFVLLSLTVVMLLSCKKNEENNTEGIVANSCGVTNPIKDLSWLKDQIQTAAVPSAYCTPYQVIQGIYQGKIVYIIPLTGALCDTCAGNAVYDCEGKLVFVCNTAEEAKIANKEVIWEK